MNEETPTQTTPDDAVSAASPRLSPAAILEATEDPAVFAPLYRGLGIQNMFVINELMKNPNVALKDRMEWQDRCMKYGGVQTPQGGEGAGSGLSITINIPQVGDAPAKTLTLEAEPAKQVEAADE